jgi:hypothetical protein
MRQDMSKIITEPARAGVGYYRTLSNDYRRAKHFKLDEDLNVDDQFSGRINPIRSKEVGWEGKSHRFAYKTAKRFIESRVGKPWTEVYSEIVSMCKTEAAKALDLKHIFISKVEINTYISDAGYICYVDSYSGGTTVDSGDLYVHPITGILCKQGSDHESYRSKRKRWAIEHAAKHALTNREVDGMKFEKIDDIWFEVWTEECRDYRYPYIETRKVKRTLSKAELRHYELN